MKRIIIDIGHPAQVHHFKNFYRELEKNGWDPIITAKDKEISIYLLRKYNLKFKKIGTTQKGLLKKILYLTITAYKFFKIVRKFKPDMIVSRSSAHSAHISKLLRIPHIAFSDTENVNLLDKITVPFVDVKLTANSYKKDLGKNHFRYSGNIELAYLHPNRFVPDKSILKYLGIEVGEKYVIIRFVSWDAHHDIGHGGISPENKIKAVKEFSKHAKVFITSEKELPEDLKPYQINIPPERMHDVLAFASLLYGESATMASECACLGVPSIYLDNVGRGYTDEEEGKYGLVFNYTESLEDQERSIKKGVELLTTPGIKGEWQKRRKKMLEDKIDVTAFMVWFVENYPESVQIMKKTPIEIQDKFR